MRQKEVISIMALVSLGTVPYSANSPRLPSLAKSTYSALEYVEDIENVE